MTNLRKINNQDFLQELRNRLHSQQLTEQEINSVLEAEQWKKAFLLAERDSERQKEIKEWDKIQAQDE